MPLIEEAFRHAIDPNDYAGLFYIKSKRYR